MGDERAHLIYFTTALNDYADPDEEQMPWDDPRVTHSSINGKTDDSRCNEPWEWWHRSFKQVSKAEYAKLQGNAWYLHSV